MKQIKCNIDDCNSLTKLTCRKCGKPFCGKHIYSYVDGSNCAITKNNPLLCKECYIEKYGNR